VQVFHYHLVTSKVRHVEARYLGKLGFELVARHGRIGEEPTSFESGVSWDELERRGFKLRLSELEQGAVNVVLQPGQWDLPRVDHIGLALSDDEFTDAIVRASELELRIQEHGGRRTFIATGLGYRLELHPPREWLEDLLGSTERLHLSELQLQANDPIAKAEVLADLLNVEADRGEVVVGDTVVRFLPGGPEGRPELYAELFT
jgi:hypothetical protein